MTTLYALAYLEITCVSLTFSLQLWLKSVVLVLTVVVFQSVPGENVIDNLNPWSLKQSRPTI